MADFKIMSRHSPSEPKKITKKVTIIDNKSDI